MLWTITSSVLTWTDEQGVENMPDLLKKIVRIAAGISLLPAAVMLMKKHADINTNGKISHLYSFAGKEGTARSVLITNQTPAKLAKKAVKIVSGK